MYAVVGCSDCSALWVVEGRPETTGCPQCGSQKRYERLRKFYTGDSAETAKEARARLLAERQDEGPAFESVADFATLERQVEDSGVDDETYLAGQGVDPERVTAAGERASQGRGGASGPGREAVVRAALRETESPTEADVRDYAEAHGVDPGAAAELLRKLVRAGEVVENRGTYRLV